MIADVASIRPGKWYLTTAGQVRRVVEILPDGRVAYQRRPAHRPNAEWQSAEQDLAVFANLALREIPCDWTPQEMSETQEPRALNLGSADDRS